ncbi:CPBP family intramembrane glutamic endopeptidase [Mobilicoccus caccae]|uniref:CAAX prenyl protease 2/Lysostaphin resistance protein A-like domain-containing protein n=1 Tax=Mobilicoccus caccae TaxID=1859295 RepID=A0ABQ6IX77_9MICO|nr:CPBP family intramembrane glutamic endopeptidase [Mobilicoccus caccae]GMA41908.1 hypothetical protein GCM10025883_39530 [Mobilicoccus caccae]
MNNRLAQHLTTWKAWYALFAIPALIIGSLLMALGGAAEGAHESATTAMKGLMVPLQFIAFAVLSLGFIALFARRWPTTRDLGLTRGLDKGAIIVVLVVFVVSHAIFWLIGLVSPEDPGQAQRYFDESGFTGPLLPAVGAAVTSVILAPVCEELLYRGAMLRPIHDAIARRGSTTTAAIVAIAVSSVAFALPHLGDSLFGTQALAYVVTGAAFGIVYVMTGSMTAAMVSHSLQSWAAFSQILIFGRGDAYVSPIIWILILGCPLWVYLVARGLRAISPKGREVPEQRGELKAQRT